MWANDPRLEWCPPGHGNIYAALATSGALDRLLAQGYEHAFVSNIDNLGAVIDPAILGYFAEHGHGFMMEATRFPFPLLDVEAFEAVDALVLVDLART